MKIPFNKPCIIGHELDYIRQSIIEEAHLASNGKFARLCQNWLEETLNCPRAFMAHSCTAALEMAALVCGIGVGDEIIMPSFTFVSTANAFVLRGAVPVFVDIRPDTLNLNEELVAQAITENTKAIVPVHYAGVSCEMSSIVNVAEKHGLWVIEDAAQALLSRYKDRHLGTIGHLGCLSFHETKNITSGEGGALLLNDRSLIDRAEVIWDKGTDRASFLKGQSDRYTWVSIGSSFCPGEMVSAFLFAQLEKAHTVIKARKRKIYQYSEGLRSLSKEGFFDVPSDSSINRSNGHMFYVLCRSQNERSALIQHLRNDGILAVFHYVPLHSSPAGKTYGRVFGNMHYTEMISRRLIRLPLYYGITEEEVSAVIRSITAFYTQSSVL